MAFNGSGTYNLPAGNPVVTGTTISTSWANTTLSDIASALTNCVTRDGQSPATADLPMGSHKITNLATPSASGDALSWGKTANVSALTVATFDGLLKGTAGVVSAAIAGTDYVSASSTDTLTNKTLTNPTINGFTGNTAVINIGSNQIYKDTSGNVGFGVVPTSGINAAVQTKDGIKFPATQVPSTDPNVLDDYEEGALLPSFAFVTPGTGSITTTNKWGSYVKVGKKVTCSIYCYVSAVTYGTASGGIYIDALPFFSSSTTNAQFAVSVAAGGFVNNPAVGVVPTASKGIYLYKYSTGSGAQNLAVTDLQVGSYVIATLSYMVD